MDPLLLPIVFIACDSGKWELPESIYLYIWLTISKTIYAILMDPWRAVQCIRYLPLISRLFPEWDAGWE